MPSRSAFLVLATVTLVLLTGCYGAATPRTCYAKFVRDKRGEPGDYDRCLAKAARREAILDAQARGELPTKTDRALAVMSAMGSMQQKREPEHVIIVTEPGTRCYPVHGTGQVQCFR